MNWSDLVCNIVSRIAWILPSSGENTLPNLADNLANSIPFVGSTLVYMFAKDLLFVLTLVVGFKLIKILPVRL